MTTERAIRIGPDHKLCGVWAQPEAERHPDLAVLFLNAGLLHKVGPYRMNVDLGRRLAADGVASLRFDFGGLGDSPTTYPRLDYADRFRLELSAIMDQLEEEGRKRFVVFGLCSGAVNAHRAATFDNRVAGVVALDGFAWPTTGFYVRHYGPRALQPSRWVKFAGRKLPALTAPSEEPERPVLFEEDFPERAEVAKDMRRLVRRGCRMLYIYTGGVEEYLNYRGQLEDGFRDVDFEGLLDVEYYPDADHTYTALVHRRRMFACVQTWLRRTFS